MAPLRIALAQVNPTVGDLSGNAEIVLRETRKAVVERADLIVFPEMMLTGYPVEDLALRSSFQRASMTALTDLAATLLAHGLGEIHVVVGYLGQTAGGTVGGDTPLGTPRGAPQNCAAVVHGGEIVATYAKHHLPNYGVFDEFRYFVPGRTTTAVRIGDHDVAIAICEDLWQDGGPVAQVHEIGADLLVVLNGSPYERNKDDVRLELCQRRAREAGCPLVYVNMVGGQDELVFDGDSLVVDADGTLLARAPQFSENLLVVDLGQIHPSAGRERLTDEAEVYAALVLGLRDYVRKNGFTSIVLGLSGGIDSALVAVIACDALGADNVNGVSMPSVYSSGHSRDDAADLADRTGLNFRVVEIAPMVAAYLDALHLTGVAEENLQARVRGTTLMALSNQEGHLVLATGNKSEVSVGYSTIYGDAVGGFAPIKDVAKTMVWALSRWRNALAEKNAETPPIPQSSIDKEPSAELRPDQRDSDSLPDYHILDDVLDDYVERDRSAEDLWHQGFDAELVERVLRLTDAAEHKRRQYPPGTKISLKAFGRDRRLPITNRWREPLA